MSSKSSARATALQLSLRAAVAAGLSVVLAQWLALPHPIYALLASVIVMDLSPQTTRRLALQRLAGTVVGAAVGVVVSYAPQAGPLAIAVGVFGAMLLSHALNLLAAARLAGYVCGIVILTHADSAWSYGVYRIAETFLGIGMAVLVSQFPKVLPTDSPDHAES